MADLCGLKVVKEVKTDPRYVVEPAEQKLGLKEEDGNENEVKTRVVSVTENDEGVDGEENGNQVQPFARGGERMLEHWNVVVNKASEKKRRNREKKEAKRIMEAQARNEKDIKSLSILGVVEPLGVNGLVGGVEQGSRQWSRRDSY